MTTNSTQVLGTMLSQLTGIHIAAGKVEKNLGMIRTAALGAGAVFAGWKVVDGLIDATKHAEKLNHELIKIKVGANLNDAQTTAASNLAFKVSRDVPGTSVDENVKQQRELFGVFGNMDTAQSLLPIVAQASRAVGVFGDKYTDLAQILVRGLELRGHITKDHKVDPAEFTTELNAATRSIIASEGLVDPQKLFMFIRQAGPAARNMSGEQMWGMGPAVMNALGAGPAGTAIMSLFQQFIGHVVAGKRVAIAMEDAGMLTPGKWHVERGGKVVMDKDAVPDQAGLMDHPFAWMHDHLEALQNRKGKDGKPLDVLGLTQEIFQISSRQTTARLLSDLSANYPILLNEEARWKRTPNPDVIAKQQNEQDLSVNIHNLNEAWNNFLAALGGPGVPIAINVLHGLTDDLNALQEAIIKHPVIAADMFKLAGGIGALTALGGGLVVLNTTWRPLVGGLKLLMGAVKAEEVATIATASTRLGLGISGLASAFAAPAAVAMIAYLAKLGSDSETPENRARIEVNRRNMGSGLMPQVNDGFGPDGRPIPFVPPRVSGGSSGPAGTSDSPLHVVVKNGKDIAQGTGNSGRPSLPPSVRG